MSAINYALDQIKHRIPKAILEKTFVNRYSDWRTTVKTNIDEQILVNVIRGRVLVDCNLVGGTQALIPLEGLPYDKPNDYTTVIHIPKSRTQNRSINSVLHLAFLSQSLVSSYASTSSVGGNGQYTSGENSAIMGAAVGMIAAMDKIPVTSSANVQLISENTIMVKDVISIPGNGYLRCILANDENLNHIQPRSYPAFAKLVEFAVKAYIYNELIIQVDAAELQGGQTLGIFKTILEGYSDAEQNYEDYLKEKFEAVLFQNDTDSYRRYLKLAISGHR